MILELLFMGFLNYSVLLSKKIFEINMSVEYSLDAYLFRIMSGGLSFRETIVLECVWEVMIFY